jgi:hypothetical protein
MTRLHSGKAKGASALRRGGGDARLLEKECIWLPVKSPVAYYIWSGNTKAPASFTLNGRNCCQQLISAEGLWQTEHVRA